MSVLVFAELDNGSIKKSSLEAIYYGAEVAKAKGTSTTVLAIGESNNEALAVAGKFGASKVLWASDARLNVASIQAYSSVLAEAVSATSAEFIILAKSSLGDAIS